MRATVQFFRGRPGFVRLSLVWSTVLALTSWAGTTHAASTSNPSSVPTTNAPLTASAQAILRSPWFPELLRFTRPPDEPENHALLTALHTFAGRTDRDDFSALTGFIEAHPEGAWEPSLRLCLAAEYFRQGCYSKALGTWEGLWTNRHAMPAGAQEIVTKAAGHLAETYARVGRMDNIRAILPELEQRARSPADGERLLAARGGLSTMEDRPEIAFRCGALALDRIRAFGSPTRAMDPLIFNSRSTTNGVSLSELAQLSRDLGMDYRLAFRAPGAPVVLPSVVHWKLGHYAALVTERNGLIQSQDPTFWEGAWLSHATLDHEASGYFLVPPGPLPAGWRAVGEEEGQRVFGKGSTQVSNPDSTTPLDQLAKCESDSGSSFGMANWNCHLMLVSQRIVDTPVGYRPPVGPEAYYTVSFNQRRNSRYERLAEWTDNWTGMLAFDPRNGSENLVVYLDGGWLVFTPGLDDTNIFHGQWRNPGEVVRIETNRFEWRLADGSKRIYGTVPAYFASNSLVSSVLYLTGIADAAGNTVTLGYDSLDRLRTITDAVGQVTRLFYEQPDPGLPSVPGCSPLNACGYMASMDHPYLVTRVTDPFGRSATFGYGLQLNTLFCTEGFCVIYYYSHSLSNIVDIAGIESRFSWTNLFGIKYVGALTTPYGTTRFSWGTPAARIVGLEVTHPNGETERIDYAESPVAAIDWQNIPFAEVFAEVPVGMPTYNRFLSFRNTFHWDRSAYATGFATNDYSKARIYHWLHENNITACSGILESFKLPLEGRIWFAYAGQPFTVQGDALPTIPGTSDKPSHVGRTLDDGTSQIWRYERNALDNITHSIDPAGRTLSYTYAANGVDLTEVRQTRAGQDALLCTFTYNSQHLPLTFAGPDRQTNRFTYNARGQILTFTNPKNEVTELTYHATGFLSALDGPLPGTQDRSSFTYDPIGRVRTATDQDGYVFTFAYDDLDRLTRVTYPDATFEQITYDRLDPSVVRDRLGRETRYTFDSLRQLTAVQDTLGRVTRLEWCGCGALQAILDPLGRMTRWLTDVQGRVVAKEYPNGARVNYEYERRTSRLQRIRDEKDQIVDYRYGIDDRLVEQRYSNTTVPTPGLKFGYDADYPRLVSMEDGDGVTRYTYHPIQNAPFPGSGRLASVDGPWANDTVTYAYDPLGRVIERAIHGLAVARTYDAAGRLTQLTNRLGAFHYTWEGGSQRLSSIRYPNNQRTDYAYHPNVQDQLLQRITHRLPDNSILSEFTYAFNAGSQITRWTQMQDGVLKAWAPEYDAADRLSNLVETSTGRPPRTFAYTYDALDNRLSETLDGVRRDFAYNTLNQLASTSDNALTGPTYEWDAEQRLAAIRNGTHRTEFSYDGFGRRTRMAEIENEAVVSERRYLWCGLEPCEEREADGGAVRRRFFALGEQTPTGDQFHFKDHLGSVREVVDGALLRVSYAYDPFGARTVVGSTGPVSADRGFGGHWVHPSSALLLTLFRGYSPALGRWLSRDPLDEAEGLNLYAFVGNDPLNKIDPLGLADLTLSGTDRALQQAGNAVKSTAGELTVVIHGNKDGSFVKQRRGKPLRVDPAELARQIRALPGFREAKTIRLLSCRTAQGNFPQSLADYLDKEVLAPTEKVSIDPQTGEYTVKQDGTFKPFSPQGRPLGAKQAVDISISP